MDSIGQRLKEWRKKKGLTTTEISAKTGLSTGGLSAYERDEKLIGARPLIALWSEYNLDIHWLLTGENKTELSPEEEKLLYHYRKSNEQGKKTIMTIAEVQTQELTSSTSKIG